LRRKLISVLAATLLCLTALPWTGESKTVTRAAAAAAAGLGSRIDAASHGINPEVLSLAIGAVRCATASADIKAPSTLTVIDYSLPSVEPRLWVFDLNSGRLLFKELVAHGRNTGDNMATHFSDAMNSHQTSLGLFLTGDTYVGSNGYSLRLDGLEPGFNGRARDRAIVMHGAPYVSAALGETQGRIGRSWGCPALREGVAREVIDTIRGGGLIFSYYPDSNWLKRSRFLNGCGGEKPFISQKAKVDAQIEPKT
jgi:hypothetical protein